MEKDITVYYDKEADLLAVLLEKTEGYFKETDNDLVMEKISNDNCIIGFSIINVSKMLSNALLNVHLEVA